MNLKLAAPKTMSIALVVALSSPTVAVYAQSHSTAAHMESHYRSFQDRANVAYDFCRSTTSVDALRAYLSGIDDRQYQIDEALVGVRNTAGSISYLDERYSELKAEMNFFEAAQMTLARVRADLDFRQMNAETMADFQFREVCAKMPRAFQQ